MIFYFYDFLKNVLPFSNDILHFNFIFQNKILFKVFQYINITFRAILVH